LDIYFINVSTLYFSFALFCQLLGPKELRLFIYCTDPLTLYQHFIAVVFFTCATC